jgi:hypothetical protein
MGEKYNDLNLGQMGRFISGMYFLLPSMHCCNDRPEKYYLKRSPQFGMRLKKEP